MLTESGMFSQTTGITMAQDRIQETFYSGLEPPTEAARRSLVLLAASICDHHGWSARSVIGHKEWSDHKIDPGRLDMVKLRTAVARRLDEGPPGRRVPWGLPWRIPRGWARWR